MGGPSVQLHGPGCGICTYNAYGRPFDKGNIGVKESKCTHVTDSVAYVLVAGVIGRSAPLQVPSLWCCSDQGGHTADMYI